VIGTDLEHLDSRLRHKLILGKRVDGSDVWLSPYSKNILVAGTSGGGKSTLAMGFLEGLEEHGYQYLITDPEGDYSKFPGAVALGDERRPPSISEVLDVLSKPFEDAVVNLTGVALNERPAFFAMLLPRIQELRATTGRPHWIVIDESHHVLPFSGKQPLDRFAAHVRCHDHHARTRSCLARRSLHNRCCDRNW
jgi:hypothetical protein